MWVVGGGEGYLALYGADNQYTYEKINLNILNNMPLFGVRAFDASQNVFKMHALPSKPCL